MKAHADFNRVKPLAAARCTIDWTARLDDCVDSVFDRMVEVRRHLHANPEVSGEERRTTAYLTEQLGGAGLKIRVMPEGCGLTVESAQSDEFSRRVGLRADIDALHITEAKATPYASQVPGVMHACGHDGHTATVFGTILALHAAAQQQALPVLPEWRALFQPAEETNRGALQLIENGAVDGLSALFSLHMDPSRPVGTIAYRTGVFTANCDELRIDVRGRGGHASRPHESIDPIATAAHLVTSLYQFVPRGIDSHDPLVLTIGQIAGGESYNVIPDHVTMRGTLRSFGSTVRQRAIEHIEKLARGLAEASDTRITVAITAGPPSVLNEPRLTALVRDCAVELLGAESVVELVRPSMGGEDFAHYLQHVSGTMFRLGCAPTSERAPGLHSPFFDLDERAMAVGAKILSRAVVRWTLQHSPPESPS